MYRIDVDDEVHDQVAALSAALIPHFLQLLDVLELVPWNSEPYNDAKPDGSMRTLVFGPPELPAQVVFLIVEDLQRVDLLRVTWLEL